MIREKLRMAWGDMTFESPRDFEELVAGRVTLIPVAWRTEAGEDRRGYFADSRFVKNHLDRVSPISSNRTKYWFKLRVVGRDFQIESPLFYLARCPEIRSNAHFVVEIEYEGEGTQSVSDVSRDPAAVRPRMRFALDEIDQILTAFRKVQSVLASKCRPSHAALVEITQRWEAVLRQFGALETAAKLTSIRDAVRQAEREIDSVFGDNRPSWNEVHSAVYEGPNPPGHGLDSAMSMLVDDLHEMAGGQNVNISKWLRPRFEETVTMGIRYGNG